MSQLEYPVPKVSQWKKIFGLSRKPKVTVQVGSKAEEMTETQAYRFDELAQSNIQERKAPSDNPLEQSRYTLEEAAFRLMTGKGDILKQAGEGLVDLYVNAAGLSGRWRRIDGDSKATESSTRALRSGYLGLTALSCKELALRGHTDVLVFELPDIRDPSKLEFDAESLQELSAWGHGKKCFCVQQPLRVDREEVVLLAPLVT